MIRMNNADMEFRPGMTLMELLDGYYAANPKKGFEDFVVVVNNAALSPAQAQAWALRDRDEVYIVPKLDGG